jgi:hypothetical protein
MSNSQTNGAAARPVALLLAVLAALGVVFIAPRGSHDGGEKPVKPDATAVETLPPFDIEKETYLGPLLRFVRTSRASCRDAACLPQALAEMDYKLECLIALVPDPIDSRQGYRFDLVLEALQRAVEARQYLLDNWYLPWKLLGKETRKTSDKDSTAQRPQEWLPGTLLFRHAKDRKLLAVFLVGETPTAGIQRLALTTTLDFLRTSGVSKDGEDIRILGPTFSGSATSLALTLSAWSKKPPTLSAAVSSLVPVPVPALTLPAGVVVPPSFQVISGSATAVDVERLCEFARPSVVRFRATVHKDDYVWEEMLHYLKDGQKDLRVALLAESDTAYGLRVRSIKSEDRIEVRYLPFPLHISQVRTVYNKETLVRDANLPTTAADITKLPLPFDEKGAFRDIVPPLNRALTAATAELTLTQILATIARENFRYVGLMATDTRDKLFLAGLIRDHCPDVQFFTLQSDLLLSHPSYRQYLKGTLVASTYPLLFKNQNWAPSARRENVRRLIPLSEDGDEGVYNATLALLGDPRYLLEYGAPGYALPGSLQQTMSPPIWISIVGERGPWPVKVIRTDPGKYPGAPSPKRAEIVEKYVYQFSRASKELENTPQDALQEHLALRLSGAWLLCLSIVTALAWGLLLSYLLARPAAEADSGEWEIGAFFCPPTPAPGSPPTDNTALTLRAHAIYVFACFASLGVFYGYLATLLAALLHPDFGAASLDLWNTAAIGLVFVTSIVLLGILTWHLCSTWRILRPRTQQLPARADRSAIVGGGLLLVVFAVLILWGIVERLTQPAEQVLITCERVTNFEDGVSPVLPVFFLCALVCAWSLFQLKRLYLLNRFRSPNPFFRSLADSAIPEDSALGKLTEGIPREEERIGELLYKIQKVEDGLLQLLQAPWREVFYHKLAVGGALILALGLGYLGTHALPSFEGRFFDIAIRLAFVTSILLFSAALLQFVLLWVRVRRLLRRIVTLPMAAAFDQLPARISDSFGRFFSSLRPRDSLSQISVPLQQWQILGQQYSTLPMAVEDQPLPRLDKSTMLALGRTPKEDSGTALEEIPSFRVAWRLLGEQLKPASAKTTQDKEPVPGATESERLNETSRACVAVLRFFWPRRTVPDAFAHGSTPEPAVATGDSAYPLHGLKLRPGAAEFLQAAEAFVAMRAVPFVGQFFVHLRNLVTLLSVAAVLLLLAIGSYPFQPQRLLILWGWGAVLTVLFLVIKFFVEADRDELLSRISRTKAGAVTFDWTLLSNVLTYVVPLGLLLITQIPVVGDWLSYLIAPLTRALR